MKVPRKDLGLSPPRLFPALTASIERQRLLFLASMSPPRNVFTNFPSPRLQQSPPTLGVQDQNAQDEDEDRGPFEIEVLSDNEGYKSNEEVPVSAPGRRFKETLREPKPPRVNQYSHGKSRLGEVDTGFVLSKLTPECLVRDQRQFCCSKTCVWNLGINMLRRERKLYFRLTRSERVVYLDTLITKLKGWRVTYRLSQNIFVCRKAFKIVFSVGNNRLQRMRLEDKHPAAPNTVVRQPSAQAFILLEWLDSFFLSHCERQPGDGKYHLPNNFTKKEVYDHYKTDMSQMQSVLQYSSFKRYWLKYYPLVTIPTTNKFSVCDFCELYKTKRDKAVTKLEKAEAIEALQPHRKQQAEERATAGRRRWKALDTPKDCAYIQIDGMDQKKTALPHFSKQPKSVDGAALVGVHLVGAMVFHGKMQTRAFLTYNNIKSDSNLTITVLHKILLKWEGPLPPTLYLQLDNTVRENKNNILFAYLAMLLDRNIFSKIKLGFLLVGRTHDFVDQMFSRFSQALRRENAFTMSRLRSVIQNSYDPKPITSVILQTWDFKHFIETEPKLFRTLNDITHNQQYKFKLASTLDVRVWCKQFSTDQTWEPPTGVKNYVNADGARLMLASQQLPLKSYAEIKRQTKRAQNIGTLETAQEGDAVRHVQAIRQDIQAHCYPFFEDVEKDWWNHWFFQQEDIGRNIGRSIRERLTGDMCWLWPVPPERDAEEEVELLAVTTAEDLRRRVFGIRRPIYSGPRKPPPGSAAADRAAHIGELTEIHDKSFLAVLAEDEISFWICQVLKINGRNEAGEPTEVMIQWYATEDSNPYTGKFYPEKRRSNGKGRPVLFRQEVNLEAVTILSFNFIFTTTRRLRRITERQIRTGLFRIARDKEASELDGNISPASDIVSADDEETDCSGPDSDPDVQ
ncbi:hypothetical protein R1sor_013332 [Riccia sorocarpa]|uniref:DUF7869 domain-containing protein n=1 Tax=Riccia sorocarpa TaxID=122646 RepID=A0ABD3H6U5_9MARC